MSLKFAFKGELVGTQMRRNFSKEHRRIAAALHASIDEASARIIVAGKADMKAGGNFGSPRWQNSLQAVKEPKSLNAANIILKILHIVPFAHVFEYGATIKGKPLLWIPLPWNKNKVRAREFPGKLFRVNRKGKNPLLMQKTGAKTASAMYVGVKSVKLKRRFHLRPIIRRVAKTMPALFRKWMRIANKKG